MSVCPSVQMSVYHSPSNCFFFFVSRWNRAIFWPSFLHDIHVMSFTWNPRHFSLYKTFFDFWFRPPNAQNLLPKICTKSPISRLVWQIDRRCLGLPGGFGDGRFNGTMQNVVGPTLVAMATKFGLGAEIRCLPACNTYQSLDRDECKNHWPKRPTWFTVHLFKQKSLVVNEAAFGA